MFIERFKENLTGHVWREIERDKDLMKIYRGLTEEQKNTFKKDFGKKVKTVFELDNNDKEKEPKSGILKSFTKH